MLDQFKQFLLDQKENTSKATIKNYLADIRKFISWYQSKYQRQFESQNISYLTIEEFKKDKAESASASSVDRYLSTLRKFFYYLKVKGLVSYTPFEIEKNNKQRQDSDPWHIKDFKNNLYIYNASHLTIKNYIIDVKQFLTWAEEVTASNTAWKVKDKNVFNKINNSLVNEYKRRLTVEFKFSPLSVNRKLSSLRRYLAWIKDEGLIKNSEFRIQNLESNQSSVFGSQLSEKGRSVLSSSVTEKLTTEKQEAENRQLKTDNRNYSNIPPVRLIQKIGKGFGLIFDIIVTKPLANTFEFSENTIWKLKGRPIFKKAQSSSGDRRIKTQRQIENLPKAAYAPLSISTKYLPTHKKLWHHVRYTRPKWYTKYHSYSITNYFHLAILVIFMSILGFNLYRVFFESGQQKQALAAVSPLKILSFQGRLTDSSDNPITASKLLRFVVYNDLSASAGARLWEEVDRISPDTDGIFSILLGSNGSGGNAALCNGGSPPASPATGACGIPQSLFANNATLYLGVTVEKDAELTPRQQVATVAYATNAEVLQGMPPTTDAGVTTNTNAILALNSSGQVSIGGTAVTTFQSTGGQITLLGKVLQLTTATGTNTDVQIVPDGSGKIDLQKPLKNTTATGNLVPGGVEVDDKFGILATESAVAGFVVSNDGGGDIMTASVSGATKMYLTNAGNLSIAGAYFVGSTQGQTYGSAACVTTTGGIVTGTAACPGGTGGSNWTLENGTLHPNNATLDVLI
ncbi:MAG: site-specific integrase, partial [Patescibacteria group bacterium]|nr:site-specific integrase [Patescibacteria group bacterium]